MAASGVEQQGDHDNNKGNGLLLYCYNYSYYSQKVIMALHEKKLAFTNREVQITRGEQYEPWFLSINPKGEVPVLQDGVRVIPDSSRIIDYLEDNFSNGNKPRLVPKDLGTEVKQKVDHFRTVLDQLPAGVITMGSFYHPELCKDRRFPFNFPIGVLIKRMDVNSPAALTALAEKSPEHSDALMQKVRLQEQKRLLVEDRNQYLKILSQVEEVLNEVESELAAHTEEQSEWWLCCETFTVADICLCILLERLRNVGLAEFMWGNDKRPNIEKYLNRVEKRESFIKTMTVPPAHVIQSYFFSHSCPMIIAGAVLIVALSLSYLLIRRK